MSIILISCVTQDLPVQKLCWLSFKELFCLGNAIICVLIVNSSILHTTEFQLTDLWLPGDDLLILLRMAVMFVIFPSFEQGVRRL